MCGIAGSIGWLDEGIISAVRSACGAMTHRGPDSEGFWASRTTEGPGAALAFRRLAIIDLAPEANQPMHDPASGCVQVFNGEIYNYRDLRSELEKDGDTFHTRSDSEVLLKAYARWGAECVHRLRGMFGLAIWDPRAKGLFLARDRMGIKPIYHVLVERGGRQTLLFASELRALLATGLVPREIDPDGLATYLWNGVVMGPTTLVRRIRLMPAGCSFFVDAERPVVTPRRYWRIPRSSGKAVDRREARLDFERALTDAVAMRLVSDVPLGVFLSGGIDSSAIAAIAQRHAGEPVHTFNISFEEQAFDESNHARAVADAIGTRHETIILTERLAASRLDDALGGLDQPSVDAINTYYISRAVREAGLTVALAGTGGDELFGGYQSFRDRLRLRRIMGALRAAPMPVRRLMARALTRIKYPRPGAAPPQVRWGKLEDLLTNGVDALTHYQLMYGLYTRSFHQSLFASNGQKAVVDGLPCDRREELVALIEGQSDLPAWSQLELSCYLGERLLRDTDSASMAVSLEVRVPLIDQEVLRTLAELPDDVRFHPLGRKQLLRDTALAGLDRRLFERPKSGFLLPMDVWMRGQLRPMIDDLFADGDLLRRIGLCGPTVGRLWRAYLDGAPGLYWTRVWAIAALAWWCREHRVSMAPSAEAVR